MPISKNEGGRPRSQEEVHPTGSSSKSIRHHHKNNPNCPLCRAQQKCELCNLFETTPSGDVPKDELGRVGSFFVLGVF